MRKTRLLFVGLFALIAAAFALPAFAAPLSGAIFTTNSTCTGTNVNIFEDKDDVYLNGGPAHPGAAGLPDGNYYVKVTEPNGTLLGTSVGSANQTPVHVTSGEFDLCYQLSAILIKASDSTPGYDDTGNSGGEYKVWVSTVDTFANDSSKTDNFKVKPQDGGGPLPQATLHVLKYYDADADGQHDPGEVYLDNWKFHIQDNIDWIRYTPVDMVLDPDEYSVSEFKPNETNWIGTDIGTVPNDPLTNMPTKHYVLADKDDVTAEFGNVCVGAGGGKTLGFWSNNNGQATMNDNGSVAPELALLSGLNLRNANGTNFDPATYAAFRSWLLSANANNMANMLSAQLAAMRLNVESGLVSSGALIYAPGATNANPLGFATVDSVMAEANNALADPNGNTTAAGATRTYQEALKNALDKANNNLNFVQSSPCKYTFPN
jgi:hypothetical protein